MKKTKKIICLALVMLMVLSLAACGKTEEKGGELKPVEGGMFVYAIEEPITSLNYYNNSSTDLGLQVFKNIYDPLWYANADGTPDYRLAKSVEISEDGTTYTVTLRDDITWSDGKKITVDDLMFTLDVIVKTTIMPSTSSAYKVDGTFCEYKKESDTVATITVGRGSNLFKKALGGLFLLPAHCFEGVALEDTLTCKENETIATSGAYKVDSFSVGEKIVCVKRDDYYRTKSHIDGFEVRVIGNTGTQEIAFKNGELALFTISNAETLATYKNDSNYKIVSYPDGRITFLEINPNAEATATIEMRQAIISALNIDELVFGTYGDAALCDSANSILSKVSMFYDPSVKNYTQDLEKAKKLIDETGIKDKEITIIYNSARVGQEELAIMIESQLKAAGLKVKIDSMETAAYFKKYFYATDSFNISMMGNGMLDDPSGYVGLFAHTRSGANMYTTPEVDARWTELDKEMDPAKRQQIMKENIQALYDCWSCVPVLDTNYVCVTQPNVGGLEDSVRLTDLTKVYFLK